MGLWGHWGSAGVSSALYLCGCHTRRQRGRMPYALQCVYKAPRRILFLQLTCSLHSLTSWFWGTGALSHTHGAACSVQAAWSATATSLFRRGTTLCCRHGDIHRLSPRLGDAEPQGGGCAGRTRSWRTRRRYGRRWCRWMRPAGDAGRCWARASEASARYGVGRLSRPASHPWRPPLALLSCAAAALRWEPAGELHINLSPGGRPLHGSMQNARGCRQSRRVYAAAVTVGGLLAGTGVLPEPSAPGRVGSAADRRPAALRRPALQRSQRLPLPLQVWDCRSPPPRWAPTMRCRHHTGTSRSQCRSCTSCEFHACLHKPCVWTCHRAVWNLDPAVAVWHSTCSMGKASRTSSHCGIHGVHRPASEFMCQN